MSLSIPLPARQHALLDLLNDRDPMKPPTLEELGRAMRITRQGVFLLVKKLERKGYLLKTKQHRSIRLTEEGVRISRRAILRDPIALSDGFFFAVW